MHIVNGQKGNPKLAAFIQQVRNEKGLSVVEVERRSGNKISDAYISRIESGDITNVSPPKLEALAKGLGVSFDVLFHVAMGKSPEPMTREKFYDALELMGITEFAAFSEKLTPDEMEEVIEIYRATLVAKLKRKRKQKK